MLEWYPENDVMKAKAGQILIVAKKQDGHYTAVITDGDSVLATIRSSKWRGMDRSATKFVERARGLETGKCQACSATTYPRKGVLRCLNPDCARHKKPG